MRVLILADDCNPEWPSLPIVGFKAARAIAERVDVVVATHVRNQENIDKAGGIGRAEVAYLDNEYVARPLHLLSSQLAKLGAGAWTARTAMRYPGNVAFEYEAKKRFGADLRAGRFDVIHRLTPMSPTLPSPLASWADVPFILGPINGGLRWPRGFESELHREREYLTYVRNLYRLAPYYLSTLDRSAAILASFSHTMSDLPEHVRAKAIDFPEVGIDPDLFAHAAERPDRDRVTFVFAGRLVPLKCADVLVDAFASSETLQRHRLVIVGDGPERERLERAIARHGLEDSVELVGWKKQAEVATLMRDADVFAFPSIRELGAGVVVEAMAAGCAQIVVDYGGPGGLVEPGCGLKVPIASKAELTVTFRAAMERLVREPGLRKAMGRTSHERAVGRYTWDAKAKVTIAAYDWVLGRGPKPDFYATPTDLAA
jgi:glycosyltransferase involved in cell wall biosynthesis